jgi:hypothetical protein
LVWTFYAHPKGRRKHARMRPVSNGNKALAFFRGEVFGRPL